MNASTVPTWLLGLFAWLVLTVVLFVVVVEAAGVWVAFVGWLA